MLTIIAMLFLVGVANDTVTWSQTLITILVALVLTSISVIAYYHNYQKHIDYFWLDFIRYDGYHKTVRAYTYAGRARAIKDYKNLGYTLYAEAVVEKEDE